MKKYVVFHPDEDGNPVYIFNTEELNEFLSEPDEPYIIKTGEYSDPNYWEQHEIMIFELGEQIIPKIKMSV